MPPGAPAAAAAYERPVRVNVPVVDPAPAEAAAVPAPTPTPTPTPQATPAPTPAPAAVALAELASPTPKPTLSGTMPPATVPPMPDPPPPTVPTPIPATQFGRAINATYVPLRSSPSGTANVLIKVPHGQIAGLFSITSDGIWYRATYRSKTGYVKSSRFTRINLVGRTLATQYPRVIVLARVQQHVEVWENQRLMLISAVTTGRPELPTPLGTTRVLRKESPHLFESPWAWPSIYWYPPGWADFAVLFRSGGFYFHDTHARPEYGYGKGTNVPHTDRDGVVRTGSRGCANTPYWAVRMLYGWAVVGDPVVVIDK